jgi:hypothetical protein
MKEVRMAYNEKTALRIRAELGDIPDLVEKKMFGGVGYIIRGNMACGVHKEDLIVRLGAAAYQDALLRPHTRPFDMTGRPMTGWVMVAPPGFESEADLKDWVELGVEFALSLPAK